MFHESPSSLAALSALLIDGDNVSARHTARIATLFPDGRRPNVARVYGNICSGNDWHNVEWVRPVLAGQGKNAADMLLTIEAMELALTHGYTRFTLVSSDGDFAHLAEYLRKLGHEVTGMGKANTPAGFRNACTRFLVLEKKPIPEQSAASPVTDVDQKIRAIIQCDSREGEGIKIVHLASGMRNKHGITIKSLGLTKWRSYLSQRASLYALDPKGPDAKVRFLPKGFDAAID